MRNIIKILIITIILNGCTVENPFVSKEELDEYIASKYATIENVVIIHENDIYYFEDFDKVPVQITNTPNILKTNIKIHPFEKKFVYLDSNRTPIITDINGNVLSKLTQFSNVKTMDWTSDGQTLYMLIGNNVYYYGKELSIPPLSFEETPADAYEKEVISISISSDLDVVYIISFYSTFGGPKEKAIFKINDSETTTIIRSNNDYAQYKMKYLNFSNNGKDLVLGYSNSSNTDKLSKLELYTNNLKHPFNILKTGNLSYITPTYRSDLEYLVFGQLNYDSNKYRPFAYALKKLADHDKKRDDFESEKELLFIDWR